MLTIDDPAYFDRLAEVEDAHWWALGMWRLASYWLDAALGDRRGLTALDIGCGAGLTITRLSQRREVARVVGLDPSPEALAWARRRHDGPLVRGGAIELPFPDRSFDLVTCFDVLQHLPEGRDVRAAAEVRRVLRPGGVALIRSNARGWSSPPAGVDRPYRLRELVGVLRAGGLRVRRATLANCLPALAQEVRGRVRAVREGGCRPHPAGGGLQIRVPHPWVNRLMGGVAAAESALAGKLGVALPFGHSTIALAERGWDS